MVDSNTSSKFVLESSVGGKPAYRTFRKIQNWYRMRDSLVYPELLS
ncbi:hypothetical protein NOS3756_43990 [Nostoc sp. NIES-3756]|nr:hypothetical protein NOS3756_43990 [Nostoc sp. NIES-3756]